MSDRLFLAFMAFATLDTGGAAFANPGSMPGWLLGDWTPVEIHQNEETLYPSKEDEPKNWLAGQHLAIVDTWLTLADDRCERPAIQFIRERPSVILRKKGSGTLESLNLPRGDEPAEFIVLRCAHELHKFAEQPEFTEKDDRGIPINWYIFVHSPTEIDMPFFGGSYIKFRKTSPAS